MSKLLLVEDDKTIVENLCVFLQQEGFLIESAMALRSVPTLSRIQIYR